MADSSQDEIIADYIIVGAGSAGCVLANRLSADGRSTVVLLEAGGDDRPGHERGQFAANLMIQIPIGYAPNLKNGKVNWLYQTEPDAQTGNRQHAWPRGKVLGGSSAINGMLYVRGQRADYDRWRQFGCAGWSADDVLPYFKRSEDRLGGESPDHGAGGPLHVSDPTMRHPVSEAVIAAWTQYGLPRRDINGSEQEGVDWFQLNVRRGRRCSAAAAYLHPARRRGNLRVVTRAHATAIVTDCGRASAVTFIQNGVSRTARANGEIIIAAGAIGSPQLLQLSGIGPSALLREHGVPVVRDLVGVGGNLQDHYIASMLYRLKPRVPSINARSRGLPLVREIIRYVTRRSGVLALSAAHVAAFSRSRQDLASPDLQFHVLPATIDIHAMKSRGVRILEREPGLTFAVCQLRPESRGSVCIRSADPAAHPAITANYLADATDREVLVAGLRQVRAVVAQPGLVPLVENEFLPGPSAESDEDLLQHARATGGSIYHPVGTCAMGTSARSVVDARLRVHQMSGLRVVDASVMPWITSGNTNAPVIMIAEKASDMILEDRQLASRSA